MSFGRYQQVAIEADGQRVELSPRLRSLAEGTLRQGDGDEAAITVWGIARDRVGLLQRPGAVVEVTSGYLQSGPPPGVIVRGVVIPGTVREFWERPEHGVSVQIRPAWVRDFDLVEPRAWDECDSRDVLDHVTESAGIEVSTYPATRGVRYVSGYTVQGDPIAIVRAIAKDAGWEYAMGGGSLDVWRANEARQALAIDLDSGSGMVGSPTRQEDGSIEVTCLCVPALRPGRYVRITSRTIADRSVVIKARAVAFSLDSYDGPFTMTAAGTAVDAELVPMTQRIGLPEAIDAVATARAGEVRVCRTARVTRVRDDGTVDVQPDVAERFVSRGTVTWQLPPEVPRMPVQWWRSGGAVLAGRLSRGDRVTVLVRDVDHCDADRDEEGDRPTSARRWSWSDGIVLAGFTPAGGYPSGSLPSDDKDMVAYMEGGGVLYIGDTSAVRLLARADLVLAQLSLIESAFNAHSHVYIGDGSGATAAFSGGPVTNTGTPPGATRSYTAPATASDIASTRVKVDD